MSFEGVYDVTINTPMGTQTGKLTLNQAGTDLTGTMEAQGDSAELMNGKVDGDTATWDVNISKPMPMTLSFEAKAAGEGLGGSVKLGAFGQSTFEATKA